MLSPARKEPFAELYPVPGARTDQGPTTPPPATTPHPLLPLAAEVVEQVRALFAGRVVLTAVVRGGDVAIDMQAAAPRLTLAARLSAALGVEPGWVVETLSAQRPDGIPLFVHLADAAGEPTFGPFDIRSPLDLRPAPAKSSKQTQKVR